MQIPNRSSHCLHRCAMNLAHDASPIISDGFESSIEDPELLRMFFLVFGEKCVNVCVSVRLCVCVSVPLRLCASVFCFVCVSICPDWPSIKNLTNDLSIKTLKKDLPTPNHPIPRRPHGRTGKGEEGGGAGQFPSLLTHSQDRCLEMQGGGIPSSVVGFAKGSNPTPD